uniref:ribonuclease H n=1 Tax=Denticeps clupeoides TaxID=299321 RepID=A0AAY4BGI3_9TELE
MAEDANGHQSHTRGVSEKTLEGLQGIYVIADDILITGEGETWEKANQDHDNKLRALLNRCREKSIKLNVKKFQLRRSEVPYIGHLITADGLRVEPEKVRAVRDMPCPVDVKDVQRFLGMINNLSKFCDHLSDAALLQKGVLVAYGSRTLTPTERGYAQIEKECLAIVYGMEKILTSPCLIRETHHHKGSEQAQHRDGPKMARHDVQDILM